MKKNNFISIAILLFSLSLFYWECKKEQEPEVILVATSFELISGDEQTGEAGKALVEPVEILVKDQNGNPFKGATINFALTEGSVSSTSITSNTEGKASVIWILGSSAGEQSLIVTILDQEGIALPKSPLTLKATATLVASSVELVSGAGQTGTVNKELADSVVFIVKDQNEHIYQGATIYFSVDEGSVSHDSLVTDASGKVNVFWTLGPSEGEQTLTAQVFKEDKVTELSGSPLTVKATAILMKPTVETNFFSNIRYISTKCDGSAIDDGGAHITGKGICWSIAPNPTIEDNKTNEGGDLGTFTSSISNLNVNTTYFVRAYATNVVGTGYGEEKSFKTLNYIEGSITDYDGNVYNHVLIGNQVWMKENLKVTHYSDGTAIPLITDNTIWGDLGDNNSDKAYCYYNNNTNSEKDTYGALYTWAAAMNSASSSETNPSGIQGVCPSGWHLPSDVEWKELEMHLGMSQSEANGTFYRGTNEGSKLSDNAGLWNNGNLESNAEFSTSGFAALPGGIRDSYSGPFNGLGIGIYFWSATEGNSANAWNRCLNYNYTAVSRYYYAKSHGFSVRCIKD